MTKSKLDRQALAADLLLDLSRGSYEHLRQVVEATISEHYDDVFGAEGAAFRVVATYPEHVLVVNDSADWRRVRYGLTQEGFVALLESVPVDVPVVDLDDVGTYLDESVERVSVEVDADPQRARARVHALGSLLEREEALQHRAVLWTQAQVQTQQREALAGFDVFMESARQRMMLADGDRSRDLKMLEDMSSADFSFGDLADVTDQLVNAIGRMSQVAAAHPSVVLPRDLLGEMKSLRDVLQQSQGDITRPRLRTLTLEHVAPVVTEYLRATTIVCHLAPPR